jgi:hypothetical protein
MVPRRNLGHRVCCSHMTATRSTLGILIVGKRLATHILSLPMIALAITTHHMSNRVIPTCIMSTIPHEHVHSVFTSRCIASTFKIIAPQNNESSTPQIHKLSKGVSKMVVKLPHKIIFRTRNYGTLLFAFLPFKRSLDNPRRLDSLPPS